MDRHAELVRLAIWDEEEKQAEKERQAVLYETLSKWQRVKFQVSQYWPCRLWRILSDNVTDKEFVRICNAQELQQIHLRLSASRIKRSAKDLFLEAVYMGRVMQVLCRETGKIFLVRYLGGRRHSRADQAQEAL